jgi:ribosomal protein S18 acetylase RimI-like enzyme
MQETGRQANGAEIVQPSWRPAGPSDLSGMIEIAARIHPGLQERPEVFAEKMRLFPEGCRTLVAGEEIVGYGLSHAWTLHQIPPLDDFLRELPRQPDCLYVHDVAVQPQFRGRRIADSYIRTITTLAQSAQISFLALVSVHGTDALWSRLGFRAVAPHAELRMKLRSYGETAKYMICDLGEA